MISQLSIVIAHLSNLTAISNLAELLHAVVADTPQLIDAVGCSIYLQPDWLPAFSGELIDANRRGMKADQVHEPFIVLAATNQPGAGQLIGRAFYGTQDGVVGRAFAAGSVIRLADVRDPAELCTIAIDLKENDRYDEVRSFSRPTGAQPVLVV
ncbi:MAG TPA: hypothetical protein VFK30_04865, partial [Anaerolineae bacterium]|nr:hypothetical protein [Anaerolineae bacterium]